MDCLPNYPCWDYIPAGVQIVHSIKPAPDDHFAASPHSRVVGSGIGRARRACGCPTVGAGIVSPARVQIAAEIISSPNDHFTASPDCCVKVSSGGRVGRGGGRPTIGGGSDLPPVLKYMPFPNPPQTIISLPVHTAV